jgi:hypothetical protein
MNPAGSRPEQEVTTGQMTRQMTRAATGPHSLPGDHLPRVLLKSGVPKTGYVDGAWWPYSDDLAAELPVLLTALNSVLGAVERVVYHLGEWSSAPGELAFAGRVVRLDGYRHCTMDTIEVLGPGNHRTVLLVVPPNTDPHYAFAAMSSAADPDNESTVEQLLMIGTRERDARTRRAAAEQRWKSGSVRLRADRARHTGDATAPSRYGNPAPASYRT